MSEFNSKFTPDIDEYLKFREGMGFSEDHRKHLVHFDNYCFEKHPDENQITERIVRGWLADEIEQGRASLANKASAIRIFAEFVGNGSYVLPTEYIPKRKGFIPYIMTQDEITCLFDAIDRYHNKKDPFYCLTLSTIFRLLYCAGLRPGEARRLKIDDVNLKTGELYIRCSKKNKDRLIVVSDEVLNMLHNYYLRRAILNPESDYFFVKTSGQMIAVWDLTTCMERCWKAANPDISDDSLPRLRPYDLRHLYASTIIQQWLDEGKNLYVMLPYLRAYMGHVRFEDTAYYIHILPNRLVNSPNVNWEYIDSINLEDDIWKN